MMIGMMQAMNTSIKKGEHREKIIARMFIKATNGPNRKHEQGVSTREKFEFGKKEEGKKIRDADF